MAFSIMATLVLVVGRVCAAAEPGWSISASGEAEYPYILPLARATGTGASVHDRLASVALPEPPCTGVNKQKALLVL